MLGFRRLAWTVFAVTLVAGCGTSVSGTPQRAAPPITAVLDPATATVLAGKADAKNTVEVYEDFMCPFCATFERATGALVDDELGKGAIKVRYHLLNLLDAGSVPVGYSTLAANAALTVAQLAPEKFMAFHALLFAEQPEENKGSHTVDELVGFAKQAGVTDPRLPTAVGAKTYDGKIAENLAAAEKDPSLKQHAPDGSRVFGTPTVLVNGRLVNWRQPGWLTGS